MAHHSYFSTHYKLVFFYVDFRFFQEAENSQGGMGKSFTSPASGESKVGKGGNFRRGIPVGIFSPAKMLVFKTLSMYPQLSYM